MGGPFLPKLLQSVNHGVLPNNECPLLSRYYDYDCHYFCDLECPMSARLCDLSYVNFEIQTNLLGEKKCFFNKKFLQTRSVTLITSKCILLPAAFLKERMNQVKNRYAEIVEHRSYKSILNATQAKNSNIYNQIKCVLEYSKKYLQRMN